MSDLQQRDLNSKIAEYDKVIEPLLYYAGSKELEFMYIADIHLNHHLSLYDNDEEKMIYKITKSLVDSIENVRIPDKYIKSKLKIIFAGDSASTKKLAVNFYKKFAQRILYLDYKEYKDRIYKFIDIRNERARLEQKNDEIGKPPELIAKYKIDYCANLPFEIYVVLGNHEYIDFDTVEQGSEYYKKELEPFGIKVLDNEFINLDNCIIYGGTGFAKYDNNFNADTVPCCRHMQHNCTYEIEETEKFERGYREAIRQAKEDKKCFVSISHYPVHACLPRYDREAIYFTGHTHHNLCYREDDKMLYADNQIGYQNNKFYFKYAYTGLFTNPYASLDDGCHITTLEVYHQFLMYLQETSCQYSWYMQGSKLEKACNSGTVYVIKSKGYYGFFIVSKSGISIINKKQHKKISQSVNIDWIYKNFDSMVSQYMQLLTPLRCLQNYLSSDLKKIGFDGGIHGSIVDIDFYNHIMIDPYNGGMIFYYSPMIGIVQEYDDFWALLNDRERRILREGGDIQELQSKKDQYLKFIENNPMSALASTNAQITGNDVAKAKPNQLHSVSMGFGPYAVSRKISPLQKLFDKHTLRAFDPILVQEKNDKPKIRKNSYLGRAFGYWRNNEKCLIVADDMSDCIKFLNLNTNNITNISLMNLRSMVGLGKGTKAYWLTYSKEETVKEYPEIIEKYLPQLKLEAPGDSKDK